MGTEQNSIPKPSAKPFRRRVYYISGFDARGAPFYHQLYKNEAAQQQAINNCSYQVSDGQKAGDYATSWTVTARGAGTTEIHAETLYTFLSWEDLTQADWTAHKARVFLAMAGFYWRSGFNGGLAKTLRYAPRYFWSQMSALVYFSISLLVALPLGWGLSRASGAAMAWLNSSSGPVVGAAHDLALVVGLITVAGVLKMAMWGAVKLRLVWLMRSFPFMLRWGENRPPLQEARWAEFAAQIHGDLLQDEAAGSSQVVDEVIIIGTAQAQWRRSAWQMPTWS